MKLVTTGELRPNTVPSKANIIVLSNCLLHICFTFSFGLARAFIRVVRYVVLSLPRCLHNQLRINLNLRSRSAPNQLLGSNLFESTRPAFVNSKLPKPFGARSPSTRSSLNCCSLPLIPNGDSR